MRGGYRTPDQRGCYVDPIMDLQLKIASTFAPRAISGLKAPPEIPPTANYSVALDVWRLACRMELERRASISAGFRFPRRLGVGRGR